MYWLLLLHAEVVESRDWCVSEYSSSQVQVSVLVFCLLSNSVNFFSQLVEVRLLVVLHLLLQLVVLVLLLLLLVVDVMPSEIWNALVQVDARDWMIDSYVLTHVKRDEFAVQSPILRHSNTLHVETQHHLMKEIELRPLNLRLQQRVVPNRCCHYYRFDVVDEALWNVMMHGVAAAASAAAVMQHALNVNF